MMPQVLPILGSVAVYPCAVPISVAQGDEEDAYVGFSGKKGGRGPGTRGEGFGLARRREGRSRQEERREEDGGRGSQDPHAGRATPAAIRRPPTRTLLRGGIAGPRES